MGFAIDIGQEFRINEYILQTIETLESLRANYPSLKFEQMLSQLIYVEVPEGSEEEFRLLEQQENVISIPQIYGLNATEALSDANILMFHEYPFGNLRGEGVIIGFVDTGIDYTNQLFKNKDNTTRILRIWDQTISGNPPEGFTYGTQYTEEDINRALKTNNPYEIVPSQDVIGHGTFLAGIAAGDDKTGNAEYTGGAPDAAIAVVKLREVKANFRAYYLIESTTNAYQENDIIAGMNYLLDVALKLQKPLVICIGLGNNYGAHDSSSIMELYFTTISAIRNVIVTVAAGNEANSAHHFRGKVIKGGKQDIEINAAEDEELGFIVYLWAYVADKLAVSIRSPLGQRIEKGEVTPNQGKTFTFNLEKTKITIIYNYPDAQTGAENVNIRFEKPTPGIWTITVYGEEIVNGVYNMWLQRSGFIKEGTRFLNPDTLITVCIPGTAEYVLVVGAYNYIDQSIYVSSGRGPMVDGKIKPELVAPGVNIKGPKLGGGYTSYEGTSTASAIAASAAALFMEWAVLGGNMKEMNSRIARDIFIIGTRRSVGIEYPNPIEGYGKLDLRKAITSVL